MVCSIVFSLLILLIKHLRVLFSQMESITEQNIRNIVEEYGDIDYIAIRHHKFSKEVRQDSFCVESLWFLISATFAS